MDERIPAGAFVDTNDMPRGKVYAFLDDDELEKVRQVVRIELARALTLFAKTIEETLK